MFYLAMCLLGVFALFKLPVNLMPNAGAGSLTVFIGVRGGLPPQDIENLVTKVVEEAVATAQHLRTVMSVSRKDKSVTTLVFEPGTDMSFAALEIQERLAKIRNKLPKDIEKPVVARYSENDYPVIILAMTSDKFSPEQLREIVDNNLKPLLIRVNGVANVEVGGGRERKILVEFDQTRLEAYRLSIRQIINKIGVNNLNLLTGKMDRERDSSFIRYMGQYQTIQDIKDLAVAVTDQGSRIRLEDIAEVRDFYMEPQSYARLNKKPTVSVYVQKESDTNTLTVAAKVRALVKTFEEEDLPPKVNMMLVTDQSKFIQGAVDNVRNNLTIGALLTWFIIFLFLKEWKHTTLVFVSVPVAVLITFGLMFLFDIDLNVMTLSALALGIGMVVDNGTVVLENILYCKTMALKKNAAADIREITIQATEELSVALVAGTLTTIVVFLPIVFISKQVQILYSGLAYTLTFAIVISLFIAITLVPIMASRIPLPDYEGYFSPAFKDRMRGYKRFFPLWILNFFGKIKSLFTPSPCHPVIPSPPDAVMTPEEFLKREKKKNMVKRWFSDVHDYWAFVKQQIRGLRHHPRRTFLHWCSLSVRYQFYIFTVMCALTFLTLFTYVFLLEKDFLGSTEPNEFIIFVELPAGAKLDISDQVVAEVEKVLSDTPEISKVVKTAAARVEGWSSKVYVTLAPRAERTRSVQDIITELRPKVKDIGAVYDTFIYFSEPESSKEFLIDVFGHDYDVLRDLADRIAKQLEKVKGLTDLKLRYKPGRPEVQIIIDKEKASVLGFTVKDIAETLHAQVRGLRGSFFYTDNEKIEIIGRIMEKFRKTIEDINVLTLTNSRGEIVPVKQISEFKFALTPSEVWRKAKQRMIQVSANREDLPLSTAAEKSRDVLRGLEVPTKYYHQIGGDYVDMIQNEKEFRFAFIIMAGLVFIVLASMFESYLQAFMVMMTIPMALIGSIPLLYVTGTPATMSVYIGMIMLGGIVVNAAIILVEKINFARRQGMSLKRAVLNASLVRLRPILNTSLTTIINLIPMIIIRSESSQLWSPLALTVIGGTTVATFLTLFMIPSIYYYLEEYKSRLLK